MEDVADEMLAILSDRNRIMQKKELERHFAKKARRGSSKNRLKGSRKRTAEDDRRFEESFEKLLYKAFV